MTPMTPPTMMQNTKKVAKNSGELAGAALAMVVSKIALAYGIPVTDTEAIILGGFLVSVGANIRHLIKDE